MGDYVSLGDRGDDAGVPRKEVSRGRSNRVVSLDVFRGFSIALMIFVDYAGSILPFVAHSPWDGVRLADFVMPFFLFIAGISISIVYKNRSSKFQSTCKAMLRAVKLFILGILLQGGYFHGINALSYGVDIEKLRIFGILQRIAIGYIIAALCEIWLCSSRTMNTGRGFFNDYCFQWIVAFVLSGIYLGLLYGMYVPDWQFETQQISFNTSAQTSYVIETVKCGVRGDLGPACNVAGMIDRNVLGIDHLYQKPVYRNLKECTINKDGDTIDNSSPWCKSPFDPEGLLSSLTAAVTSIFGLQFGHILLISEDHKSRLMKWLMFSLSTSAFGVLLAFVGMPLNKSLYSVSYLLLTTGVAGITFCALYALVDVHGYRVPTIVLEWMGKHSLSIFVLVPSNIAIIALQGFYWRDPKNNIVHWVVSLVAG